MFFIIINYQLQSFVLYYQFQDTLSLAYSWDIITDLVNKQKLMVIINFQVKIYV